MNDELDQLRQRLNRPSPFREDPNKTGHEGSGAAKDTFGGTLIAFSFSGADVFDENDTMDVFFSVSSRIYKIDDIQTFIHFREFFAPASAASSGGSSTPTSDASSAASSAAGGSSTPTTDSQAAHRHQMTNDNQGAIGIANRSVAAQNADGSAQIVFDLATNAAALYTYSADGAHTHSVTIASHTHGITHTHDVTIVAHTHDLTYGVFKETMPVSHSVSLKVYRREAGTWTLLGTFSGLTDDDEELDLTDTITESGQYRLTLQSDASQPQGGRLGCDVYGHVVGAVQAA